MTTLILKNFNSNYFIEIITECYIGSVFKLYYQRFFNSCSLAIALGDSQASTVLSTETLNGLASIQTDERRVTRAGSMPNTSLYKT